jgi:hypothetical protein
MAPEVEMSRALPIRVARIALPPVEIVDSTAKKKERGFPTAGHEGGRNLPIVMLASV